jgi:alanine racemase
MTNFETRPTFAKIDLDNLRFNFRSCRKFMGSDVKFMAVVKANAYGHGAVECARALEAEGVEWFGVALVEEGLELRHAEVNSPILCLGGTIIGQEKLFIDHKITPVIFNLDQAAAFDSAADSLPSSSAIHIKIDTGMGRLGVRWDQLDPFISGLQKLQNIHVEGLMSHFAVANDPLEDDFTDLQIARFFDSVKKFESFGIIPDLVDIANSPGAVGHPASRAQMVRLGGILYGLGGDVLSDSLPKPELKPVLTLHSTIADIKHVPAGETLGYGRTYKTTRDSKIGVVPIGYNDGYRRALSNNANVLVRGQCVPVVGRISMDWTIIDLTDVPNATIADRVTLIGQEGSRTITSEDLAGLIDTISYEITCGLSERVPRRYDRGRRQSTL